MKTLLLCLTIFLGYASAQCPISNIEAYYNMNGAGPGIVWFRGLTFTNTSSKTIAGIKFSTASVDAVSDVHPDLEMVTSDSKVNPGATKKLTLRGLVNLKIEKEWVVAPTKILYDDGSTWSLREQWDSGDLQARALLKTCFGNSGKCGPKSKASCKDRLRLEQIPEQLIR